MSFRSTLDIDTNDRENIQHIIYKIFYCNNLIHTELKPSDSKGFHVILWCSKECDICRLVYDDFRRFAYDQKRPKYARNILFEKKIRIVNLK